MNAERSSEQDEVRDERFQKYLSNNDLKLVDQLSKPVYRVKKESDIFVETPGGRVCLDIYRPDAEGEFPAIVTCSPYSKDVQISDVPAQPFDSPMFDHQVEAGDVNFMVTRGYSYVIMDAPGTGKSEGEYRGPYSADEQKAIVEVIEWTASQKWCSGQVGMNGISHFGIIQMLVAAHKPKHLKAIFPVEISVSEYDNVYNEGILNSRGWFIEADRAINNPVFMTKEEYGEEGFKQLLKEALDSPDVSSNSYLKRMLAAPRGKSFFVDSFFHPLDGSEFWNVRSPVEVMKDIDIPTYIGGIWTFHSLGMALGPFRAYNDSRLKVPKKLIIYANRGEYSLPYRELNWEILRWYDHWLKGIDTGMMNEPPIKMVINGDRFRYEDEWPIKRTKYPRLYLRTFGRLLEEPEDVTSLPPDVLVHTPPIVSKYNTPVRYQTDPFKSSFELTGFSILNIYCSIDTQDANFVVKTFDVSPDGRKHLLQNGYLKASHRKIKEESDWMVMHDHTSKSILNPGEIYGYKIQLSSVSKMMQPGHRIELQIDTQNISQSETYYHKFGMLGSMPSGQQTIYKLFRDRDHLSYLQIPIVSPGEESRWVR